MSIERLGWSGEVWSLTGVFLVLSLRFTATYLKLQFSLGVFLFLLSSRPLLLPATGVKGAGQAHDDHDPEHPQQVHADDAPPGDRRFLPRGVRLLLPAHRLQEQVQRGLRVHQLHGLPPHGALLPRVQRSALEEL